MSPVDSGSAVPLQDRFLSVPGLHLVLGDVVDVDLVSLELLLIDLFLLANSSRPLAPNGTNPPETQTRPLAISAPRLLTTGEAMWRSLPTEWKEYTTPFAVPEKYYPATSRAARRSLSIFQEM